MTLSRTLLVEDFEPFRRLVRGALERRTGIQIVGEAVDGLDAVERAHELQPDLILLDIGLPKLNGLAAALQIRSVAPNAKLLFISIESSHAVVREAFRSGAAGYIYKMRTQIDIIPAIEAVLAGKRFVSCGVDYEDDANRTGRHELHFYSDEKSFVEIAAPYVGNALECGGSVLVFATPSHRESIREKLKKDGFDMDNETQQGNYISLDAAQMILKTMVNGAPDNALAAEVYSPVIHRSIKARKSEQARVAMLSETSAILCAEGNEEAAIQIESGGNGMVQTAPIDILCAYPLATLQRNNDGRTFKNICGAHTAVCSR